MDFLKKREVAMSRYAKYCTQYYVLREAIKVVNIEGLLYRFYSEDERSHYFILSKKLDQLFDSLRDLIYKVSNQVIETQEMDDVILELNDFRRYILNMSKFLIPVKSGYLTEYEWKKEPIIEACKIYEDYAHNHFAECEQKEKQEKFSRWYDSLGLDSSISTSKSASKMSTKQLLRSLSYSGSLDNASVKNDGNTSAMLFCQLLDSKM